MSLRCLKAQEYVVISGIHYSRATHLHSQSVGECVLPDLPNGHLVWYSFNIDSPACLLRTHIASG